MAGTAGAITTPSFCLEMLVWVPAHLSTKLSTLSLAEDSGEQDWDDRILGVLLLPSLLALPPLGWRDW